MIHALLLFIYIIQWHAYTVNSKINATVNVLVQYKEILLCRSIAVWGLRNGQETEKDGEVKSITSVTSTC